MHINNIRCTLLLVLCASGLCKAFWWSLGNFLIQRESQGTVSILSCVPKLFHYFFCWDSLVHDNLSKVEQFFPRFQRCRNIPIKYKDSASCTPALKNQQNLVTKQVFVQEGGGSYWNVLMAEVCHACHLQVPFWGLHCSLSQRHWNWLSFLCYVSLCPNTTQYSPADKPTALQIPTQNNFILSAWSSQQGPLAGYHPLLGQSR